MEAEHSRLLKFFKESRQNKPKMAEAPEIPVIKIQKEYQNPANVESEVPGTHEIREYDNENNSSEAKVSGAGHVESNSSEIKVTGADFSFSPVITVTKNESTLTKGDMKLQKVTVTEDIAEEESENGGYRVSREDESLKRTDRQSDTSVETIERRTEDTVTEMEGEEKSQDEKKSKIPMWRFRPVVERVKRERQAQKARGEQPRRSSIPKLKDAKKAVKRDTSLNFTPQIDDEFDKLYEEIVDTVPKDIEEKLPSVTIDDPEKIETKFEEIIHAYDEDEHVKQTVSRVSKIPALRRQSDDRPSRLGALIDRAKEKTTKTETKLKDGGFKVTSSTIRTKRFSRGNSKDMSNEQQIEVTETIDIKESGDNDVFVKETVKTAPVKPERRRISKSVVEDHNTSSFKVAQNIEDGKQTNVTENVDRQDGTLNKTRRLTRTVSKETKERNINRELCKNLKDIRREFSNRIEDSRIDDDFMDIDNDVITSKMTVERNTEVLPVKTERIVRDISREMNEDGQNINSTETVTVEELEDGGTRTITTKTTESLIIGTPVVTEKIIRNISREISNEGQSNNIRGVTTVEVSSDGARKVTKKTYVRDNATGIPVKTERFTRDISKEMGNIKHTRSSKDIAAAAEKPSLDDNNQVLKKETLKMEQIEKEGVKVGIPVYTKVTRSFSKGKIQNVEMSRSVEWKPADEVRTKNYSRSVSENVTKKELKDAGKWRYEVPIDVSDVSYINDKSNEGTDVKNVAIPKDKAVENKIKDAVNEMANKISTKKVTEYKTEEKVTNVEKTTFTLSSNVDLTVDTDFKASRETGTQIIIDGKAVDKKFKLVKESGTQMSADSKYLDSPFDRDFKLAQERNLEEKIAASTKSEHYKASKRFGTQRVVEKSVSSSTNEGSIEFGTQMSAVVNIIDKESKEIGTQMSLEGNKHIQENYSDNLSKEKEINEDSIKTGIEKKEVEYSNLSTQEQHSDIKETTILKGNVSRLKDKIVKDTVGTNKKEHDEGLPKKKSVLSKIAIFESLEPKEPYPEVPLRKIKCKYVPPPPKLNRTISADRPKIVDEVMKDKTQSEPLRDEGKVEFGVYYDEVTYKTEPVKEYCKNEEEYELNVSKINEVITETKEDTTFHSQQETKDWETATILPGTIDIKTEVSQIEFAKTNNDKAQIQRENGVIEMPTIFPAKINYEAQIGKSKPGKINLNIWSTQVEINKSTVDKIDVFKGESLQEIAETLPGKVDLKAYESQIPVSRDLPGSLDLKKYESRISDVTVLPAKINSGSEGIAQTSVRSNDSKIDDDENIASENLPDITQGYLVDDVTILPGKIDFQSYDIHTEIATTSLGKIEVNNTQTEIAKAMTEVGYASVENTIDTNKLETSKRDVDSKPKPGKINLDFWKSKVETNKTLVSKTQTSIKKSKDAEIVKAFSGRANFNLKQNRVTETVQGNNVLNRREHKAEIAKTSTHQIDYSHSGGVGETNTFPGKIEFDFTENHDEAAKQLLGFEDIRISETQEETIRTLPETVNFSIASSQEEVATILPAKIYFSSSEIQVEDPKMFGKIETDIVTNESKADIRKTYQDTTHFSTTDNQTKGITTISEQSSAVRVGKLNLKAWEHQVEVNKTLVDKVDAVKAEHLDEIAQTLPGKIDFISYESHVGEAKTYQAPVNLKPDDHAVEITVIEEDINTAEEATILPGKIEFSTLEIQAEEPKMFSKIDFITEFVTDESKSEVSKCNFAEENNLEKVRKLNIKAWEHQVEVNKTLVDKTDAVKGEHLKEIAKTLPGKIDFVAYESHVGEAKTFQAPISLKTHEDAVEITELEEDSNTAEEATILPGKIEFSTSEFQVEEPKMFKKIDLITDFVTDESKSEVSETNFAEENNVEKVGKLNIKTWEHQVEVNKTLVDKTDAVKDEHLKEIAKTLPGKIDFVTYETHVGEAKTFQAPISLKTHEDAVEITEIEEDNNTAEEATILPGKIEFSTSEFQVEEPKMFNKIDFITDFVTDESKSEVSETNFAEESNLDKVGKLDLKAWEHQVEVNKTLVDKTDAVKGEHLEEIAKTLPGKIDFITYESHVGEAKTFQATIDSKTNEKKDEITRADINTGDDGKPEVAKILPETIELDPFKHTPRFNPIPMLIRLNSQENKVLGNEATQGSYDLKNNVYKVDIPIESDPGETLSDPELIDEDAVNVKTNNDSIIGSIKRKLYFISNANSVQSSINTPMNTPVPAETGDENDYEKKVEELLSKTYSINNINNKTNETKTITSKTRIVTQKSYEIKAEKIKESYSYDVTDNSTTEYELSFDTNIVENKLTKTLPPRNDNTENNMTNDNNRVTNENEFNFDNGNELTRSAYGADDFKTPSEELKRAKSLAELDLGDAVHGQVRRIVGRIKSVDFGRRESVKTEISIKEMPKKMSVLEKIALFEGKTARIRDETTTIRSTTTKKPAPVISEEQYLRKIEELTTGKTKFGRLKDMLYLTLADGSEFPVLALGTALVDPRLLPHVIGAAIDMGYRAIDTAYIYGNEAEIGRAIKAKIDDGTVKREDLFIMSKLWSTFHRSDLVEDACKSSLEKMGLDYFDLYMIHNPMSFKEGPDPIPKIATVLQYSQHDYLDAWFGMEGLVDKGLAKSIGVSNFNSQQIQRILDKGRIRPVVNQVECHPYLSQQRLHAFCAERQIILSCFGTLGSKGTPDEYKNSTSAAIDDALVKVMASGLGVTPAQLLIRYQIERGHNVVVKASSAAHLWDNLQALTFTLDKSQVDALNALNKNRRTFTFKGMGDTHRNYPFLEAF